MYQQITILGHLGGDPDLRYTPQGDAVCTFSVACNRKWTGNDGQKQEQTTWFRINIWKAQAEACNQWLKKGSQVLIVGQLQPDKATGGPRIWTDNDGNARASFEIRAFTVQFLGGGNNTGASSDNRQSSSSGSAPVPTRDNIAEDEIPF